MKNKTKKTVILRAAAATAAVLAAAGIATSASASGVTYKDGDKYVKLGGRIQLQYHMEDPDVPGTDTESTDTVFFRRFRPYIEGSVHKDWNGRFQWDMGKAENENEIALKDAYLQYTGVNGMKITIGNANFPFSREFLTSSKYQQLVERTFVGDHDYGTPDRNVGVHLTGHALEDKKLTWAASVSSASIDPDNSKLDFDTPVNENSDFNQGWMVGGRVDFHPLGELKFSQGDFKKDLKMTVSVAAFSWTNDDDNNTYTDPLTNLGTSTSKADVDSVVGFEVSAALRVAGFSMDAEYNQFSADTVDSAYNGGIYVNGSSDITTYAVEAGYLFGDLVEIVAGYEMFDTDGYDSAGKEEWTRTSVGANWFISGNHDIKLQTTYRMGENIKGTADHNLDELFVQMQYVF